jgi:hypothetical protein
MLRRVVLLTLAVVTALSGLSLTERAQAVDFELPYLEQRMIQEIPLNSNSLHSWRLTNTSGETQTYTCTHFGDKPPDWFDFMCTGDECVFDSTDVTLTPAATESVSIHVSALLVGGAAYKTLRVRSHAAQPETLEIVFTTLSETTTLIVEDDGADDFNSYYRTVADNAGLLNGVWDTSLEPLLAGDLGGKENVVWYTGSAASTLNSTERQIIADYLDAGGRLLITGQNIGEDIGGDSFFDLVLHAQLQSPDVASTHVDGVSGDPIGNGLSFDIAGGDGANNQTSPDGIEPSGSAHQAFLYDTGDGAGVRFTNTIQKLVYLGFGLEGIDTQANRQDVFDNVIAWFDTEVSSVDDFTAHTPVVRAGPNPFSPQKPIAIQWELGNSPTPWRVDWFDASGRLVGHQSGHSPDGQIRLEWNGLTGGAPLSSGVYMYRVMAGSQMATGRALFLAR